MKHLFATISIICMGAMPVVAETQAEIVCMTTDDLEAGLFDWYGETPAYDIGETRVMWTSRLKGTWTLVEHKAEGVSCTIGSGTHEDFERLPEELLAALE